MDVALPVVTLLMTQGQKFPVHPCNRCFLLRYFLFPVHSKARHLKSAYYPPPSPPGVLCQTWKATLPEKMEGIADSCLEVPCRFDIPIKEEANIVNCSGGVVWQKGRLGGPAVFNAQHPHGNAIQVGPLRPTHLW